MKTFKQHLIEGSTTELAELIMKGAIPFSEKMWNRITGKTPITMYGMHVTDWEGVFDILKKVGGRKKSLPVMTEPSTEWLAQFASGKGVLADGGIFLICQGTVIAEFGEDIGSARDKQGRRWVDLSFHHSFDLKHQWIEFIGELHERIVEEIINSQDGSPAMQAKFKTEIPDYLDDGTEYWRSDDIQDLSTLLGLDYGRSGNPLEKRAAIIMYMEEVEKELQKPHYQESIMNMFLYGGSHEDPMSGGVARQMWNELFMVDTKILKVMVLCDAPGINLPLKYAQEEWPEGKILKKNIRKVEYYHSVDKPIGQQLKKDVQELHKLNGRIKINIKKGFDFPTVYKG